ncbi:MAG TPA: hypothetical protein VMZ27_04610 [Candidatus Saccharimonadales bacterium]|nr:hypothetical protein [Candidatus Saccharimonadales bacterium]
MSNVKRYRKRKSVQGVSHTIVRFVAKVAFRLNDNHREIQPGRKRRGKRTVAKEKLYKTILAEIRRTRPGFKIGISTGVPQVERWSAPYCHWRFVPVEMQQREELTQRR